MSDIRSPSPFSRPSPRPSPREGRGEGDPARDDDAYEINRLGWSERAVIHAADRTGAYRLDRLPSDRLWRLPDGWPRLPLALSLRARKVR